jgi:hypothetical protein
MAAQDAGVPTLLLGKTVEMTVALHRVAGRWPAGSGGLFPRAERKRDGEAPC